MNASVSSGRHRADSQLVRAAVSLFVALLWMAVPAASPVWAQISATVATDQASYVVGEPIHITVTAVNGSPVPITLNFPSTLQAQCRVDSGIVYPIWGADVLTEVVVPAHGTYDWVFGHPWASYPLAVGPHQVVGRIVGHAAMSDPATFDIVAPDPVVDDVLIDFESLPDGTPTRNPDGTLAFRLWELAYAAWGVRLSSDDGTVNFKEKGSNTVLYTPSGSHPFNAVARFDMPVYRISADVGTSAGESVTMSAFDAGGGLLGTATSDPITDFPNLVGPLEFSSPTPIASVKWISSGPLSSVSVDNLWLGVRPVPEPSAVVLATFALASFLLTRRSRTR